MNRNHYQIFTKVIILYILLVPNSIAGQEDLTGQLKQRISEIESYRANITLSQDSGEISFKKNIGIKVVIENQTQEKTIIIRTPDIKWTYIPFQNKAYKIDIKSLKEEFGEDSVENSIVDRFDIRGIFSNIKEDTITFVKKDVLNGEDVYIFEGFSKVASEDQNDLEKYQVCVSVADGLLRKRVIVKDGEESKPLMVQSVILNLDIPDEEFYFSPDSNIDIVDSTEEWKQVLKEQITPQ